MGTTQELTTEQIEVLILIDEINNYIKENKIEISDETNIVRMIDEMQVTKEDCADICETLEYYGYIEDAGNIEYELTVDGKQYIRLFKEYLVTKAENPKVVYNCFTLINIEKLYLSLVNNLEIFGTKIEADEIVKLVNEVLDSTKTMWSWLKKILGKA